MVHYSVLVPVRDATGAVGRLLAQLGNVFARLVLPYEIICIDDATAAATLDQPTRGLDCMRVLRFDRPRGTSAALSAGIAASSGDVIVGISPSSSISPDCLPDLISRLSRYDFVVAVPERTLSGRIGSSLTNLGRLLIPNPRRRIGEDLLFAARRDAVSRLALSAGALGVLPELVAKNGFRVCRVTIADCLPPRGARLRSGVFKRLAAAWFDRRFEPHLARELARDGAARQLALARGGYPQRPSAPPSPAVPLEQKHGKPS